MAKKDSKFNEIDIAARGLTAALKDAANLLEAGKSPARGLTLSSGFADSMQTGGYTDQVLLGMSEMPISTPQILELARTHQHRHLIAVLERGSTVQPERPPELAAA